MYYKVKNNNQQFSQKYYIVKNKFKRFLTPSKKEHTNLISNATGSYSLTWLLLLPLNQDHPDEHPDDDLEDHLENHLKTQG